MLKPGIQGDLQELAQIPLPRRFGLPCPKLAFAAEPVDALQRRGEQFGFQKLPELAHAGQQAQAFGGIDGAGRAAGLDRAGVRPPPNVPIRSQPALARGNGQALLAALKRGKARQRLWVPRSVGVHRTRNPA
jgi:hypothetical protein